MSPPQDWLQTRGDPQPSQYMDELLVSSCLYSLNPIKNCCSHQAIKNPNLHSHKAGRHEKTLNLICDIESNHVLVKGLRLKGSRLLSYTALIVNSEPGYYQEDSQEIPWMCCHLG